MSDQERWFDYDMSEAFYGWGHQDKAEFCAWANAEARREWDPNADEIPVENVYHWWSESDDPDWETFKLHKERPAGALGHMCRPITVVRL